MKTGQNTWFRDFHARTILAPPDTGHDWKALSERLFQHGSERIIRHRSRLAAAHARIRSGCPDLEDKRVSTQGCHLTFMPHNAQQ